MSELSNVLADEGGLLAKVRVALPDLLHLSREVSKLNAADERGQGPEHVAALQARVRARLSSGDRALSRRDLRESCKLFFHPPDPPANDWTIATILLEAVAKLRRRAAFFALIDAYVDAFDAESPTVKKLADSLASLSPTWPWEEGDGWREPVKDFALFQPKMAPQRIAHAVLESSEPAYAVLDRVGLTTDGRRTGGLAEAAFRAACSIVAAMRGSQATKAQERLLSWAGDGGRLAFPKSFRHLVEGSLLPWDSADPTESHKSLLVDRLEAFGEGDPRTKPGRWREVEQHAKAAYDVLLRWLTRASVMQFLDIVDQSMRDDSSRRMWSYRRAFWTSYLLGRDGPPIQRAWVAFGDGGARLARNAARATGDKTFLAFGQQNDKSGHHAALIVEMGDLLIVDWSHSAKYNVWRRGDRGRPILFKRSYTAGELYSAPIQESHVAPANFTWQKRLASIIEGRAFYSEKPSWRPRRV